MSDYKFSINEKVVYPSHGIGVIQEIFDRDFRGKKTTYYKIYIDASEMTVLVPTDKAESLGVRNIVTKDTAQKAMQELTKDCEPITSDWKLRYQANLDLLKKGSIEDIAHIVRTLYNRSRVKELPVQERKLYDNAKELLIEEIVLATGESKNEIDSKIQKLLEPLGDQIAAKKSLVLDDEDDSLMDEMDDMVVKDSDDEAIDDDIDVDEDEDLDDADKDTDIDNDDDDEDIDSDSINNDDVFDDGDEDFDD